MGYYKNDCGNLKQVGDATSVIPAPIAPSAVTDALLSIGIKPGSVVLVHSDAIVAAQVPALRREQGLGLFRFDCGSSVSSHAQRAALGSLDSIHRCRNWPRGNTRDAGV